LRGFREGNPAEFSAFSSAVKEGDFQTFQSGFGIGATFKGLLA
jgi:hypothetical protein